MHTFRLQAVDTSFAIFQAGHLDVRHDTERTSLQLPWSTSGAAAPVWPTMPYKC